MGTRQKEDNAYRVVRRSSRSNKGQHSRFAGRKRKVDIVDDDEGEIRCLCGDDEDDGGFMIQCEKCGKWQHGGCMGYENADEVNDSYACEMCRPDLYKDVSVAKGEEKKTKEKPVVKKAVKETPVRHILLEKLILKKSMKRKTPPSEESLDNDSDFSSDEDEVPLASLNQKKKAKMVTTTSSSPPKISPPPKKSPSQEPKKKPPPIITTSRRLSQSSQPQ